MTGPAGSSVGDPPLKADFSEIYVQPDPRRYVQTLQVLDYQIPQLAMPVVQAVLAGSRALDRPVTVLDVCCSYGINAAVLRAGVDLSDLQTRYRDPALAELSAPDLIAADSDWFRSRHVASDLEVVGLDISQPAVDYAVQVGLMRRGWAEDLEQGDPSAGLVAGLQDVDVLLSTGGVGYVGAPTFERVLRALPDPSRLWAVVFVLRIYDYDDIAACFARYGLVTEQLPGQTFRQRRFADRTEYDAANEQVVRRGLDPAGKEATGWYHADCFVTRPQAVADRQPLLEVLAGAPS